MLKNVNLCANIQKITNQVHERFDNGHTNNIKTDTGLKGKSKVEALADLSKLHEQKIITDEEFEKIKKEIIEEK